MVFVAGATGFLGREICHRLVERGYSVRGLVRATSEPEAVAQLRAWGVETVVGDLKHKGSLDAACSGVDAVISTVTTTRSRQDGDSIESADQQGQLNLVDAAVAAGAQRFVYISYTGNIRTDDPLTHAKRAVEQRVRDSGMTYTILRPTFFMEGWLSPALGFDYVNASVTFYGSADGKTTWISLEDVAEFAVMSLQHPAAENDTVEMGGPEALTPREVVAIFEEESGRKFDTQLVPHDALLAQQAAASNSLEKAFAALMLNYGTGDVIPMEETLRKYPVQLRSVREYAQRALANITTAA